MTAIILCSRYKSSRVPNKVFLTYNGITHIEHLVSRLIPTGLPIFVAVPDEDANKYMFLAEKFPGKVLISSGYGKDPLARMYKCAKQNNVDTIVRVTHDKIFVDPDNILRMVDKLKESKLDYVYASNSIPGTGAEIISISALETAAEKFKDVEHISYAIKAVTDKIADYKFTPIENHESFRLLVDYPEDVRLMDIIFSTLGSDCKLRDVLEFMNDHGWVRDINKTPLVTVYTCAYNAEKWIEQAMNSVSSQDVFSKCEYLIIDDCSTDRTLFKIGKFCSTHRNARMFKNPKNDGLATSSNRALKMARGKYIIRLDADDYFINSMAISSMIESLNKKSLDVVYPDCYLSMNDNKVQKGRENHHVGGTLFNTAALNYVKFTDRLKGYEGLDVYLRARDKLKVGYLNKPVFLYRQHPDSMSKTNLKKRKKIKEKLEAAHGK